ncbi:MULTISPECIES: septum site-determining protein MinD [Thermotoga]|nr:MULTISPECIES: septum site-determining protein MinD [Thermotoga]AIY86504.1 septum site-determining protein MinD [Thermotoga sp. 2812B]EJX25945.1 septum site-determining protein MinD [Thermotoga sp. EMP]
MGNVIVVTSGKGGVGKTTITANLGCALAKLGEKVCLIDADIGLKNLDIVLGLENRIVYTMIDVVNGKVSPQEALVKHKMLKNLYLLPASQIATKEMISPNDMKAIVKELIPHFDYIIIDSPAGIERGFRNAVAPAERVLVVTTPELPAISDADRVIGLLENFGFSDEKINVIINRFKPHMVKKGEMLTTDDIKHTLSLEIIAVIPDSEDIIVASNTGIPVSLNGNSRISKNFENLARRIRGEGVPLENDFVTVSKGFLDTLKDFFSKLKRG